MRKVVILVLTVLTLNFVAPLVNAHEITEFGYLSGQEYAEFETLYIEKTIAIEGHKQQILDKIEAERIAKEEAERQARIEAEMKAKAEQEARERQQAQSTSPVAVAQWENSHYADVHERANDGWGKARVEWSNAQYYQYLQALRDDLLCSGEMQWMAGYELGWF